INNLRDIEQDRKANKKTMAVRFGRKFGLFEVGFLITSAFLLGIFWSFSQMFAASVLPLLALPIARMVMRGLKENEPGPIYNQYLAKASALHLLFGVLVSVGMILA
ncbi:MAG: prenyltransferase, partial [Bdellovibrionales bacterium]|nr:prenyltransferase [Bdellovibrionales bacterium]